MKKQLRIAAGLIIVLLTIAFFWYYLSHHTNLLHQLVNTPLLTVVWLLLLYVGWFGTLAVILQSILRLCRRSLGPKENLLLNAYSSLVNFFVPGQSGPVMRGLYLKKRHNLKLRSYIFATLMYYACYAVVSVFLLLVGSRPWWQTVTGLVIVTGFSGLVIYLYKRRRGVDEDGFNLNIHNLSYLMLATILQAVFQLAIYMVELHSVSSHIAIKQSMAYTGAADFALFVALTPGAIGIRESFLLFSRHLSHISSSTIVAASVIDRAVFIVFLAILFLVTLVFHAKNRLHLDPDTNSGSTAQKPAS